MRDVFPYSLPVRKSFPLLKVIMIDAFHITSRRCMVGKLDVLVINGHGLVNFLSHTSMYT